VHTLFSSGSLQVHPVRCFALTGCSALSESSSIESLLCNNAYRDESRYYPEWAFEYLSSFGKIIESRSRHGVLRDFLAF